jgi:hypothetical protein
LAFRETQSFAGPLPVIVIRQGAKNELKLRIKIRSWIKKNSKMFKKYKKKYFNYQKFSKHISFADFYC